MSGVMVRADAESLLLDYLSGVLVNYNVFDHQFNDIFETRESNQATEFLSEFAGLREAEEKPEAAPAFQSAGGQRFETRAVNLTYAIYFTMSLELIDDNLYTSEWPRDSAMLRASLDQSKNKNAMFLFNNAFNARSTLADGQPMCSLNHPLDQGTNANTFNTGFQMNEAALEDMITMIRSWESPSNLKIDINPKFLLVPIKLEFQASRLLNSKFQAETGNNAINAIQYNNFLPGGYRTNNFLAYDNRYFMTTDQPQGFIHFRKQKLKIGYDTDIVSNTMNGRAFERYSFICWTYRAVVGSGTGITTL